MSGRDLIKFAAIIFAASAVVSFVLTHGLLYLVVLR